MRALCLRCAVVLGVPSGAAYLDDSVFADGVEYDTVGNQIVLHLCVQVDGDANLDGIVDLADFNTLVDHWQKTPTAAAGPVAAPEPETMLLLGLGGVGVLLRRRSRRA